MSIRDRLKAREEARDKAAGPGINEGLPEGVTRYVYANELNGDGKNFALLEDPDNWFFYYVHEDGDYATRSKFFRKHTCLHSPKVVDMSKFESFAKPKGDACISCRAKAKRKLYFMLPVFDFEYGTWRVLDMKEFHAVNLINDYDKLEKAAKKFSKDYSLVGDAITIKKTSDGKSYSLESAEVEGMEAVAAFLATEIPYVELANFRDEDDIRKIIEEGDGNHLDKSVLDSGGSTQSDAKETEQSANQDAAPDVGF